MFHKYNHFFKHSRYKKNPFTTQQEYFNSYGVSLYTENTVPYRLCGKNITPKFMVE